MKIILHLDKLMLEKKLSLTELAEKIGITLANLSILKNSKAKAVRFSTLAALCRELGCQPGDLLEYVPEKIDTEDESDAG
jgi:putative transcriptional regulator